MKSKVARRHSPPRSAAALRAVVKPRRREGLRAFSPGWPEAIDRSPCFIYIDTPLPLGVAEPRRAYIRLQNHPGDIPGGNALEFYRDSALTRARPKRNLGIVRT